MLNLACREEKRARTYREERGPVDFERHDSSLREQVEEYEASRCLGAMSCEACDLCRLLCPDLAVTRDNVTGKIVIDLDYCKGCDVCAAVYPKGAIRMELEDESVI
ncbi:MAG: hypothetical protein JRG73_18615 [Deltaproteobacteria bacterium]|nr:hypothetical protein [Deltaproteobacteria bacterium]